MSKSPLENSLSDKIDNMFNEAFNIGVDRCIMEVGNYYSGEGTIDKSTTETIIRLLSQLKKPS